MRLLLLLLLLLDVVDETGSCKAILILPTRASRAKGMTVHVCVDHVVVAVAVAVGLLLFLFRKDGIIVISLPNPDTLF